MFRPDFLETDLLGLEGMREGQRLAKELSQEEVKKAAKELRIKYSAGNDAKLYAEVMDKVAEAEALNVKVFSDKNVEAAIAMLTQTVSDSDNSIPMDR